MKSFPVSLALPALVFAGCNPGIYFPDRANAPMLSKAHEGHFVVSVKPQTNSSDSLHGQGEPVSYALDAAFAPINHLGVIASFRALNNRITYDDPTFYQSDYGGTFNGHRWELGVGYFDAFGRLGRAEAYAGLGRGFLDRESSASPERNFTTNYNRYFIQAGAGIANSNFSIGGGARVAFHRFDHFQSPNNPQLRYLILKDGKDIMAATPTFFEPYIKEEVGWRFIRFNAQQGYSSSIGKDDISGYGLFYLSIGLSFVFDPDFFQPGGLKRKVIPRRLRHR